ncbi:hypothetical protein [Algibacter pacificus]|uniref:hypothetical protein n=1 Tax=Algibacter pacificus TaxID=2599389 RepID=UPI0011CC3FB3|nr:hypothetical protein [Algibacter pacificus]
MDSKYFGIITDADFINKEAIDQDSYLVEKNLFRMKKVLKLSAKLDGLNIGQIAARGCMQNMVDECKPAEELLKDIYLFLTAVYKSVINGVSYSFFSDFDKLTYGRQKEDACQYAADRFRNIFESICPMQYQILKKDLNGVVRLGSVFKSLKNRQDMAVFDLEKERNLVIQFLTGNRSYFNRELFETNNTVVDIVNFEGHLITLLTLNNEYKFEKENCFSPKSGVDLLYEAFEGKMEIDVLRFIDVCINEIRDKHYSYLVALFFSLKNLHKIHVIEKVFREEIVKHYKIKKLGDLKVSDLSNQEYKKRLDFYTKKWEEFSKSEGV